MVFVEEFQLSKLKLTPGEVEDFFTSQWQKERIVSIYFVIYRGVYLMLVLAMLIEYICEGRTSEDLSAFTHWTSFIWLVQASLALAVVLTAYVNHKKNEDFKQTILLEIYWAFYGINCDCSPIVTVVYWTLVYTSSTLSTVGNAFVHAANFIFTIIDFFIVAVPTRILHYYFTFIYGMTFIIFSYIYYVCGGTFKGYHYIYKFLDWKKPGTAVLWCIAISVGSFILRISFYFLYCLRVKLSNICMTQTE